MKYSVAIYFCVSKSSPKQFNTRFKFYNDIVTHEFVVKDIKKTKKLNVVDCNIIEYKSSEFNRELFLKYADSQCKILYNSNIKDLDKIIFSFNKKTLDVTPFICTLKNKKKVEISYDKGEIMIND
jgi:hypothetical protein